jgi:hypothetical protein
MLTKQVLYLLAHTSGSFCSGYFGDGISQTICLDCDKKKIVLLISASQVARITIVNH